MTYLPCSLHSSTLVARVARAAMENWAPRVQPSTQDCGVIWIPRRPRCRPHQICLEVVPTKLGICLFFSRPFWYRLGFFLSFQCSFQQRWNTTSHCYQIRWRFTAPRALPTGCGFISKKPSDTLRRVWRFPYLLSIR